MEHKTHNVLTTHYKAWRNECLLGSCVFCLNWLKNTTIEKFWIKEINSFTKQSQIKWNQLKQRIFLLLTFINF